MDVTDKLAVYYSTKIQVEMLVHSLDNGSEQPLSIDSYVGCKNENGKNIIRYYTGWDDNPYDGFPIRETAEEVEELYKAGRKIQFDAYNNTVCAPKKWTNSIQQLINLFEEHGDEIAASSLSDDVKAKLLQIKDELSDD